MLFPSFHIPPNSYCDNQITITKISIENKDCPVLTDFIPKPELYNITNAISSNKDRLFIKQKNYDLLLNNISKFNSYYDNIPNETAINNFLNVSIEFDLHDIYLKTVKQSADDGVYCEFTINNRLIMYCEFYNSGDIAYILEDIVLIKIEKNKDFKTMESFLYDVLK